MGDMTIRGIDDETLAVLRREAERRGMDPADYAGVLLRQALPGRGPGEASEDRTPGGRAVAARKILSLQERPAKTESVAFIREDRARR